MFQAVAENRLASTTGRWSAGDDMNHISTALQNSFIIAPQEYGVLLVVRFHCCWDMSTDPHERAFNCHQRSRRALVSILTLLCTTKMDSEE